MPAAGAEAPNMSRSSIKLGRAYATGKRKDAVARVWIKPGPGKIVVNGRPLEQYFARPVLRMILQQPLGITKRVDQYDLTVTWPAAASRGRRARCATGFPRRLLHYEPDLRSVLKQEGFLTRDPRVVERKKYGRKKARRSFQFSKR